MAGAGSGHDPGLLEAEAPRVSCRVHGPTVAAVPWARHGAGHTRVFDEQVAWLATQCSKTAVTRADADRLAHGGGDHHPGLGRRRGRCTTGSLVCVGSGSMRSPTSATTSTSRSWSTTIPVGWCGPQPGRDKATLAAFFDALGPRALRARSPMSPRTGRTGSPTWSRSDARNAVRCADPFHIVKWATEALDEVRRTGLERRPRRGHPIATGGPRRPTGHAKALKATPGTRCGRTRRT